MAVTDPIKTNFLYRFDCGGNIRRLTAVGENQIYNGEVYIGDSSSGDKPQVDHTPPTFSEDPEDAEIDVSMKDTSSVAALWVLGPPAYPVIVDIYNYDRDLDTATHEYHGWIVRPNFELDRSIVSFHCKSVWHFFERQSFNDSLSALSRYSIFDPRSGIDIETLRTGITIDSVNDERDVITVTGISEPDDWFRGGLIIAPDRDMRTILTHTTVLGVKTLTLNAAFPQFTLDVGFTADIYPGDDLTYGVWSVKFDAQTNSGAKHGGWPFMPNVDPAVKGVI
jgi:hypothetical protein